MRTHRIAWVVAFATLLSVSVSAKTTSSAKLRSAKRLLARLKLVDGAGSGLNADTVRGLKPITVIDSQGNFVGAVLEAGLDRALIVRAISGNSVPITVSTAGFIDTDGGGSISRMLSYESPDCTGTPLMFVEPPNTLLPATARVSGTAAYFAKAGTAATRTALSFSESCAAPGGGTPLPPSCCFSIPPPGDTEAYQEAASFDLSTLGLTPPFKIDPP
jgi:hypothetical protein